MSGSNENDKKPFIDPFAPAQLGAKRSTEFNPERAVLADNNAFDPNRATKVEKTWGERAKDTAMALGNSGVSGGEAIVGLGNLLTNGQAGKALADNGVDLKGAHDFYNERKSRDTKVQTQRRQDTDSVTGKIGVLMDNPTQIFDTTVESVAPMVVGMALGRGVNKFSGGKVNAVTAGAIGEGAAMAGSQAEQIRQSNKSGLLENHQYDNILTTGALGAAIGLAGGKIAHKLGLEDVDTAFVNGAFSGQGAQSILGVANKTVKGALVEGLVEELPQTVVETIMQNDATGQPWHQGLTDAAVMGVAAGMAMGGGTNAYSAGSQYVESKQKLKQDQANSANNDQALASNTANVEALLEGQALADQIKLENINRIANANRSQSEFDKTSPQTVDAGFGNRPQLDMPMDQGGFGGELGMPTERGGYGGEIGVPFEYKDAEGNTKYRDGVDFDGTRPSDFYESELGANADNNYDNSVDFTREPTIPPSSPTSQPILTPQANTPITNAALVGAESGANQLPISATPTNPVPDNGPLSRAANLAIGIQEATTPQLGYTENVQGENSPSQNGDSPATQVPTNYRDLNSQEMNNPVSIGFDPAKEGADQTVRYTQNQDGTFTAIEDPETPLETQTETPLETQTENNFAETQTETPLETQTETPLETQSETPFETQSENNFAEKLQEPETNLNSPVKSTVENHKDNFKRMDVAVEKINAARQRMRDENPEIFTVANDKIRKDYGLTGSRVSDILATVQSDTKYELSDREIAKIQNNPNFKVEVDPKTQVHNVVSVKNPVDGQWSSVTPVKKVQTNAEYSDDNVRSALRTAMKRDQMAGRFKTPAISSINASEFSVNQNDDGTHDLQFKTYDHKTDGKWYNRNNKVVPEMSTSIRLDSSLPANEAVEKALEEMSASNELGEGTLKSYVDAMRKGENLNDKWLPLKPVQAKAKVKTAEELETEKLNSEAAEKVRVATETKEQNRKQFEQDKADEIAAVKLEKLREKHGQDYDPNPELYRNFTLPKKKKTANDAVKSVYSEMKEVADKAGVKLSYSGGNIVVSGNGTVATLNPKVTDQGIEIEFAGKNSPRKTWASVDISELETNPDALRAAIFKPLMAHDQVFNDHITNAKISNDVTEVNTTPTEAQIEAGNYKKAHVKVSGLDITIENPKGSTRSGTDPDGNTWSHDMSHHYGYFKRTKGADGEHIDVYVGDKPESGNVYVVDQINQPDGSFDEHKVMLGYSNKPEAIAAYKSNFDKGWKVGNITEMTTEQFKNWLENGNNEVPVSLQNSVVTKVRATKQSGSPKQSKSSDNISRDQYKQIHTALVSEIQKTIKDAPKGKFEIRNLVVERIGKDVYGKPVFETINFVGSTSVSSVGSVEDVLNNLPKGYRRSLLASDEKSNAEKIEKALLNYKAENGDKPLRLVFKTENGTSYDVANNKASLERLLKKVKSNAGFKPVVKNRTASADSFAKVAGLKAMIQDSSDSYSSFNAYNFAKSSEMDILFYRGANSPEVFVKYVTSQLPEFRTHPLYIGVSQDKGGLNYHVLSEHGTNVYSATSEKMVKTKLENGLSTRADDLDKALLKDAKRAEGEPQDILQQTFEDQLNATFNADGKLYSYAGVGSETANKGKLREAAKMIVEGVPSEKVRAETGWFQGVDGKWRYEINDAVMKIKLKGKNFGEMIENAVIEDGELLLKDMLDHNELFEAYPQLLDTNVEVDFVNKRSGSFNRVTGEISIGSDLNLEEIKSTLMHEIQHNIQYIEGFARGGNPSAFNENLAKNQQFEHYKRLAGEVEANDVGSRVNLDSDARNKNMPYMSQGIATEDMIIRHNSVAKGAIKSTRKDVRNKLVERYGEDVISALEKQGKLEIVDDIAGLDPRIEGFYQGGRVTLIASNLDIDNVIPTFLHELGGHVGFQGMMTDKQYENLMTQFDQLVAEGNPLAVRAKSLAQRELDPDTQRLEMLPYLLTMAAQQSNATNQEGVLKLISKLVSNVKAWIFDQLGVNLKLNAQDFVALGDRMIKKASNPDTKFRQLDNQRLHSMQSFTQAVTNSIGSFIQDTPGHLSWWHKTLGSMYNLAERKPAFKPVFLRVQKFIDDIAYFSAVASEKAPTLLPRIDGIRDMMKTAITKNDNDAIGKALFEGTLYWGRDTNGNLVDTRIPANNKIKAGTVFKDSELQSKFGLKPEQIVMYREFRAGVENSLDSLTKSEMLRLTGKIGRAAVDSVMAQDKLSDAYAELERHLRNEIANIRANASMVVQKGVFVLDPDAVARMVSIDDLINETGKVFHRATGLKAEGYAPLMRFGKYSIAVYDGQNLEHFGMYENRVEAEAAYQSLKNVYQSNPNIKFERGTMSEQDFTQTMGVSMETTALFGEMLGLSQTGSGSQDVAFQEYLRKSRSQRSALKRMIHRKGTDGYSVDVTRVLASFILSNSRRVSSNLNVPQINEHIEAIPKSEGQLKDAAIELKNFVVNPQEKGSWLRSVMFAQYLGGSVSSALVNLTQTAAVTTPWLTQYTGVLNANKQMVKARAELMGAALGAHQPNFSANLLSAIKRAEEDGKLSPQEIFQLMEQAQGNQGLRSKDGTLTGDAYAAAANSMVRFSVMWGRMFGLAEQINRRVTFIASYRIAEQEGMPNPEDFARKAVDETQFVLSKASKMKWGRGNTGAILLTFKSYMVFYLELASRMWNAGTPGSPERFRGRRSVVYMAGVLILMGGVGGLPFMEDLDDAIDGLGQLMGYNFSSKQARKEFLETIPGGGLLDKGFSEYMPLDVSNRLGMGNLIPGTSLLTKKDNYSRDMLEIGGPAADFVSRIFRGSRNIFEGNFKEGFLEPMPLAIRNAAKGVEMASTGEYRNTKGEKIINTTVGEAALKSIGFQPSSVSQVQDSNFQMQKEKSFYNLKVQEIRKEWSRGVYEKDQDMIAEARQKMLDWNAKNPNQPIRVDMRAIMKKVREMRKTKAEKIADSSPRAMRQRMRQDVNAMYDEMGYSENTL